MNSCRRAGIEDQNLILALKRKREPLYPLILFHQIIQEFIIGAHSSSTFQPSIWKQGRKNTAGDNRSCFVHFQSRIQNIFCAFIGMQTHNACSFPHKIQTIILVLRPKKTFCDMMWYQSICFMNSFNIPRMKMLSFLFTSNEGIYDGTLQLRW